MRTRLLVLPLLMAAAMAQAQTTVKDAWVRSTVPQQKATGLFGQIMSKQGGRLVSVSSPAAGIAELHEMSMDGSVMKMRALTGGLALAAGQPVELKPGGYHVMMMDLKQPLKPGEMVPVTLVVEGADKTRETIELKVPVKAAGSAGH